MKINHDYGRSIEDMNIIFKFLRTKMIKKQVPFKFTFFDWGCGEGMAMKHANNFFDCKCSGIEHSISPNNNLKKREMFKFHFPTDIMNWNNIPDYYNKGSLVHYIYDGGVYPTTLSLHIAKLIEKSRNCHTFVVLILSKFPPYDEDDHLCIKTWRKVLVNFSKLKGHIEIFENESVKDPTMDGYIFYRRI